MERLTHEDAMFLDIEDPVSAMHNVTVAIFAGPEPEFAEIRSRIEERISLVPRLRQRVLETPFSLARPVWVDAPSFSLSYHLRHTALPQPTAGAMNNLVERILSHRLDRNQPLWELWVVNGLADRQWALISKAHHAIIDGVSGVDPLTAFVDQFGHSNRRRVDRWKPHDLPSRLELLANAAVVVAQPVEQVRLARRVTRPARRLVRRVTGNEVPRADRSAHRRWRSTVIDRSAVLAWREKTGASTNDVLLGYVSAGLSAMGNVVGDQGTGGVKVLVPYASGPGGLFTNEMTSVVLDIPVDELPFEERIEWINHQTKSQRDPSRSVAADLLRGLEGLPTPTLASLGVRQVSRAGFDTPGLTTVVIDAPGPRTAVTFLDQPLVNIAPAIPLATEVRLSVGIMSYLDKFTVAVTGDRAVREEIEAFAAAVAEVTGPPKAKAPNSKTPRKARSRSAQ